MSKIIETHKIAEEFLSDVKERLQSVLNTGIVPCINFIISNFSNQFILDHRCEFMESVGVKVVVTKLNENAKFDDAKQLILDLNTDKDIHAISISPHLPKKVSFRNLVNLISVDKDIDGLTLLNQGRLFTGEPGIIACTPLGILHILNSIHATLAGLHAVIIGRSSNVGRPLAQLLLNENCTVTLLHSYSKDLPEICRTADILISAVGKANFVTENFVKPGATVIDVGINEIPGSKDIVGDVDFKSVKDIAGAITAEPEGLCFISSVYLLYNTLKLEPFDSVI